MLGQNILNGRPSNLSFVRLFRVSRFLFNSLCDQPPPTYTSISHLIDRLHSAENDLLFLFPSNKLSFCGSLFVLVPSSVLQRGYASIKHTLSHTNSLHHTQTLTSSTVTSGLPPFAGQRWSLQGLRSWKLFVT